MKSSNAAKSANRSEPSRRLAAVLSHPLRCRITTFLSARTASPVEMAHELRVPLSDVAYHTQVLFKADAIEFVDSRPVRGSTEHFYKANQRNEVTDEEYARMTPELRQDFDLGTLQFAIAEAGRALDAGTMTARADHCIARIPGTVDEQGWKRLNAIFTDAYEDVHRALGESANRNAENTGAEQIPITALLTFFELPEPTRCSLPDDPRT